MTGELRDTSKTNYSVLSRNTISCFQTKPAKSYFLSPNLSLRFPFQDSQAVLGYTDKQVTKIKILACSSKPQPLRLRPGWQRLKRSLQQPDLSFQAKNSLCSRAATLGCVLQWVLIFYQICQGEPFRLPQLVQSVKSCFRHTICTYTISHRS